MCFPLTGNNPIVHTGISSSRLRLLNMFDFILVLFYITIKILVPNDTNKIFICFILQYMEYFQNNDAIIITNSKIPECNLRLLCNSFCH